MEITLENTLKKLGKSPTDLSLENCKKIYSQFPVPREQKILWADVIFDRRISGLVLTNVGCIIKAKPDIVKEYNEKISEKRDRVKSIFHYIKWEFFSIDDFEIKYINNKKVIYFNNSKVLDAANSVKFFYTYDGVYKDIVKEATISAENIFSDIKSVIPMNYAAVNTKTGHGEMAEEALTMLDKLSGKEAEVVGRTNEKNGADRLVNNIEIQTKYYATGRGSINACFDKSTGVFRYYNKNGQPMLIEVPKDQYAEVINEFRNKILEGKVPGVTNPNDAAKYIKKGKLTYNQARNLCKPGTIESLSYDTVTGAVNCSFAFGITFLTTFIISYAQTGNKADAMNDAFIAGVQVFGLAFFAHILTQQVARTTLTRQLIPISTYIVKAMGYKTTQTIVNAIRAMAGKSAISGGAAVKQLAKILRGNVVSTVITFAAFSIPDTYNLFNKKISTAQYTKNMLSLVGTMIAAGGGTLGTSVIAAKIGAVAGTNISPGVGTVIGLAGGLAGGIVGGTVIKIAGDSICEDDSVIMSRLFNGIVVNMIYEYMLSENEINVLIEKFNKIKAKDFKKLFKDIQANAEQEKVIEKYIRHFYEEIIRTRPRIGEPTPKDLINLVSNFKETIK